MGLVKLRVHNYIILQLSQYESVSFPFMFDIYLAELWLFCLVCLCEISDMAVSNLVLSSLILG